MIVGFIAVGVLSSHKAMSLEDLPSPAFLFRSYQMSNFASYRAMLKAVDRYLDAYSHFSEGEKVTAIKAWLSRTKEEHQLLESKLYGSGDSNYTCQFLTVRDISKIDIIFAKEDLPLYFSDNSSGFYSLFDLDNGAKPFTLMIPDRDFPSKLSKLIPQGFSGFIGNLELLSFEGSYSLKSDKLYKLFDRAKSLKELREKLGE